MENSHVLTAPHQGAEWLFPPESVLRRVAGEAVLLLGGGRALLLQLAHPLVAAGVAAHSRFQEAPQVRLERTMDLMLALNFGTWGEGRVRLRQFHAAHVSIHGVLTEAAGPFPAGTHYTANDPQLKLWVAATLIDTSLLAYEQFVRPLTPAECAAYYEDCKVFVRRLGIPAAILPPTLAAFHVYMQGMLVSDTLTVTPVARRLAAEVLHPAAGGWLLRVGVGLAGFVAAGWLPPHLRAAYGLPWTRRRQGVLATWTGASRLLLPRIPRALRLMPQAGGSRLLGWLMQQARASEQRAQGGG